MSRKRKLSNYSDRCRFCLAREPCSTSELFVDWMLPKLDDLKACTSVEIVDKPHYPRSICYVCLYKLEMWSEFKTQFLKTTKTLDSHFKIVTQSIGEADKALIAESTADELLPKENEKRPKIDTGKIAPTEVPVSPIKSPLKALEKIPIVKVRDINLDIVHINEDDNTLSVSKSQLSDTSVTTGRRNTRSKKIEREASTKRWVERKHALMAATGEVTSESESDGNSQLSPMQKARAKSNTEKELLERRKKLQKALKNLETNMTEKYQIKQEDIVNEERKTRSRRVAAGEQPVNMAIKFSPNKSEKINEDKLDLKVAIKEQNKKLQVKEVEKEVIASKEIGKQMIKEKKTEKQVTIPIETGMQLAEKNVVEKEAVDIIDVDENTTDVVTDTENPIEIVEEVEQQPEVLENDIEIIEVDQKTTDIANGDCEKQKTESFAPQTVTSEVSLGNATYIVTTTLDFPDSTTGTKSDISLKTNGITIDATSPDGKKIDLMNAVQLQRVQPKDYKINNPPDTDSSGVTKVQKCLKIEVEGMEAEALQRVQLGLAQFVNEDVRKRILDDVPTKSKTDSKQNKFKDTYENLDNQLKTIIERVLRNNLEKDYFKTVNLKNISPEFIKAAERSSIFQPKVIISRLNLGKLCKLYKINNLHILETVKRQRGLVGPLSRILGKRKLVLPKKFDDFSLDLKPEFQFTRSSTPTRLATSTVPTTISIPKPTTTIVNIAASPMEKVIDNIPIAENTPMETEESEVIAEKPPVVEVVEIVQENLQVVEDKPPSVTEKSTLVTEKTPLVTKKSPLLTGKSPLVTGKSPLVPVKPLVTKESKTSMTSMVVEKVGGFTNKFTKVAIITKTVDVNNTNLVKSTDVSNQIPAKSAAVNNATSTTTNVSNASVNPKDVSKVTPAKSVDVSSLTITKSTVSNATPVKSVEVSKPTPAKPMITINATTAKSMDVNKPSPTKLTSNSNVSLAKPTTVSTPLRTQLPSLARVPNTTVNNTATKKVSFSTSPTVNTSPKTLSQRKRHICSICGKELFSTEEAVTHMKNHKDEAAMLNVTTKPVSKPVSSPPANATLSSPQSLKPKPKLMRCKRCQAIVEAAHVKTHICNSVKFNCNLCECTFGAEHLLVEHLETHTQYKHRDSTSKMKKKSSPIKEKHVMDKDNSILKIPPLGADEDLEDTLAEKDPQGYSCFVCDKVFVDEEQMKDHLQMHCEEVSDDGNDKGFQCAFCGEKFQTEESLETHVGNHLLEDGDEKINLLINMETRRVRQKKAVFKCDQCDETFNSSLLLAMHLPLHEEEEVAMLTEYEKQEGDMDNHVCTICDEIFETPEELSEHLDVHNGNSHVCILCEKPFSSIRDLQEHVSTHL